MNERTGSTVLLEPVVATGTMKVPSVMTKENRESRMDVIEISNTKFIGLLDGPKIRR